MFETIIQGVLMGLFLSILIGPAFFLLIETSINKGFRHAFSFDIGIILSDIIFIWIAYSFTSEITQMTQQTALIERIGGGVFLVFGVTGIFRKRNVLPLPPESKEPRFISSSEYLMEGIKGFFLNMLNPGVVIFWLTMVVYAGGTKGYEGYSMLVFFIALIATFFSIDILKILGAQKLRSFINEKVLGRMNILIGIILSIFGVVIFAQSF